MKRYLYEHTAGERRLATSIIAVVMSFAVLPSTAPAQSGDMNCDGAVSTADIPFFVEALLSPGTFGGCDINRADMNLDGMIDGRDTRWLVAALLAGPQPCGLPLTLCNGICVDTTYNNGNCGGCGIVCPPDTTCVGGVCTPW